MIIVGIGNVEWRELCVIVHVMRPVRALEIAWDSCEQKLYGLYQPLQSQQWSDANFSLEYPYLIKCVGHGGNDHQRLNVLILNKFSQLVA